MLLLAVKLEIRCFSQLLMFFSSLWLLTDKRLIRHNLMIWVTFWVPAQSTSSLLHPQTMLITGSVYDLADIAPHSFCQIHFTVGPWELLGAFYSFVQRKLDIRLTLKNKTGNKLFFFFFSSAFVSTAANTPKKPPRVQMKCRS